MSLKMLLSNVLPRAATAVFPAQIASEFAPLRRCVASQSLNRVVSTDMLKQPHSRTLITTRAVRSDVATALREESAYEEENYQKPELADAPPRPWKLTDTPGTSTFTLTSTFQNEDIRVEVDATEQQPEEEEEVLEPEDGEQLEEGAADVGVVFNVHVTKGDQSLVFECKSDGTYVSIEHLSLEPAEGDVDELLYDGPLFNELDEKVQSGFQKYLEARQVNNQLGEYLLAMTSDKEQREYMRWLQRVHKFVQQ